MWIDARLRAHAGRTALTWLATRHDDLVNVTMLDGCEDGAYEVSYWTSPRFRGRGLTVPLVEAALRHSITLVPPGAPLRAAVRAENRASVGVLQRCGFTSTTTDDPSGPLTFHRTWPEVAHA